MRRKCVSMVVAASLLGVGPLVAASPVSADVQGPVDFESYTTASVNGQDGWSSTGAYDQAVADNSLLPFGAPPAFGAQSLRISDAVTSGSFGDQTFTKSTVDAAGEPGADTGGYPTGTLRSNFRASFDFASVTPSAEQPGLHMSVSPDRGDGARMAYVRIEDSPTGWQIYFDDFQDAAPLGSGGNLDDGCGVEDDFVESQIATDVSRGAHNLQLDMALVPGPHNDVVTVSLDGSVIMTGTSWEDYFRYCSESGGGTGGPLADKSRIVRNLELRESGTAHPANLGKGFLIDNLGLATHPFEPGAPTSVTATPGNGQASVSWTAPAVDGLSAITSYVVTPYVGATALASQTFISAATTQTITGLTNGTRYSFKVAAVNAAGTGVQSTASNRVTPVSTSTVVVHPIDVYPTGPGPWAPEPSTTGSFSFVTGAGTPPGGVGSLAMSMIAGQKVNLNNYAYGACAVSPACGSPASMTPLTDLDALRYSTYRASGSEIPTMNIEVYATGVGQYTSLVFVPNIGSVVNATWQSWDAMNPADGTWYSTTNLGSGVFNCSFQAAGCDASWDEIIADYPNAKIVYGIGPNIGTGGTFSGNVDDFTIGLSGVASVYDFEPATLPGAPTIGSVVRGNGQVSVSWTAPASNGYSPITGYVVTPYIGATAQTAQTFPAAPTTRTVTGLTNGVSYTFRVAAINAVGTGSQSADSAAATPATVPGAPTIGTVVRGNAKVTVSWTAPASNGGEPITGYVVTPYKGTVAQTPQTFDASLTTRDITGLTNGAPYKFKVAAINVVGTGSQSAFSAVATPATVPIAPTIGAASARNGSAVVSWTWPIGSPYNGGSAITGFVVTPYIGATAQPSQTFMSPALSETVTGLTNGTAYTFKVAAINAVGTGPDSAATAPVTPVVTTAVVGGGSHSCALLPTGAVQCWGLNSSGQVGDGTTIARSFPTTVTGLSGVTALAAGAAHTCALLTNGTVQCWGSNSLGQQGDGTLIFHLVPTPVTGLTGVTAIAASGDHTCALINTGTVRCWGANAQGQAGDGTASPAKTLPVTVLGLSGVTAITAGTSHVCALLGTGEVKCWGANFYGQLGDATRTNRLTPVSVVGVSGSSAVAALGSSTCAITSGLVQCWGLNSVGQLGDGTIITRDTAAPVSGLTGVTALSGGLNHACARLSGGTLKCWGSNAFGQLGIGTAASYSRTPVTVTGLVGVASVGTGSNHGLARLTSGRLRAWGANSSGQVGDGSTVNRLAPVVVLGLG